MDEEFATTPQRTVFIDLKGYDVSLATSIGTTFGWWQRGINWWIGDLARYAKHVLHLGDNYSQVFPEWVSPGLIQRCEAVASAYPKESDRNPLATWTQHMQVAGKPDRIALVAAAVDKGLTSDESRKAPEEKPDGKMRWLLAVDVNYHVNRTWFSGAGVESAVGVATWVQRTVARLKEKGLTDVACCFDSPTNHRKELTATWEQKYKGNRGPRDPELSQQLNLVRELLAGHGFACVSVDGYEADDVMASYAKTFPGKVAILAQDKDMKQCLSGERVVMLLDVTWLADEHSGDMLPEYHWYTEKPHSKITCKNLLEDTGLTPQQFPDLQCLMGDATDCIAGAPGIGEKGAVNLLREFGSVAECIKAARNEDERLLKMPRGRAMVKGLLEFEPSLDVTRKLVTLVDSLDLPQSTRI